MHFLVNDLSLHGQFQDLPSFRIAVAELMRIRKATQRQGSTLQCPRRLAYAQVTANAVMQQAIQGLQEAERRALMQWLTRQGPFWEEERHHGETDWLEINGEIVTDTAIGEAAFCRYWGLMRDLLSFNPSNWLFTPMEVTWVRDSGENERVAVPNHWQLDSVEATLSANPIEINSWQDLAELARRVYTRLTFTEDAFQPLDGHPFAPGAAERIQVLLDTLNKLKGCFDEAGQRTKEGHRLYTDHFTGEKAWFSDCSQGEKNVFRTDLTFPHPEDPQKKFLLCTWHGKVKTPQIRIHFSWPVSKALPLYVVYVGPKITKR